MVKRAETKTKPPPRGRTQQAPPEESHRIGDVIFKYRNKKKWSQHQLAIRLGCTGGAVGQWETHQNEPRKLMREKLIATLEIPADELNYGLSEDEREDANVNNVRRLVDLSRKRPPEATLAAYELLEAWPDQSNVDQAGLVGLLKSYFSMPPEKRRDARAIIDVLANVGGFGVPMDPGAEHRKSHSHHDDDDDDGDVADQPKRKGRPPKMPGLTQLRRPGTRLS